MRYTTKDINMIKIMCSITAAVLVHVLMATLVPTFAFFITPVAIGLCVYILLGMIEDDIKGSYND